VTGSWCVCLARAAIGRDAGRAMKKLKPKRRRCMVCRRWFFPAASARETQLVCCEECRRKRDRALARARRLQELDRYREDECERQRKCRRARRDRMGVGPARVRVTECHAPPSVAKSREAQEKVLETWDEFAALSRATLERKLGEILAGIASSAGTSRRVEPRCHAPP
jgi:hypothetical protein